ncbi:pilus assembly protein [Streptomyces sp. NBC_01693]|uniref:Pilus assembly protein n=1 Tax=Streptomyces sp. gb1(2016) TaxID=1828321 RepID=A0A652KTS4_9ACTN|nr:MULTISPECIES: pilus assembly protein [unclassified Streptomyces]TXS27125.1 pilus assembly protein [Streptomyces sp. gb1(2016)]WSS63929.1 pilus assembly protein [Streptomyces sp. NBC_01177]WSS77939.1 pilus assembly protein [Streptomyces sp. NBC_01174]
MTPGRGEPGRIRARLGRDRGQLTIEFTGMVPIILVTLVLLWQAVLVGYTFTLASGAADEGVRAAVASGAWDRRSSCEAAVHERLPSAWESSLEFSGPCGARGDDVVTVSITLKAPVLFPGFASLPIPVDATAGAAAEGK